MKEERRFLHGWWILPMFVLEILCCGLIVLAYLVGH